MSNLLVVDDHDLVRDTIAAYLGQSEGFVIETASSLDEALEELAGTTPFDLCILDYHMPGMDGLSGLEIAASAHPAVKFALMSGVAAPDVAQQAMSIGAVGFFPKSLGAPNLLNAVRFVLSGERYFPFGLAVEAARTTATMDYRGLTERECETLRGICEGKSNKEIGRDLGLQEVTIKLHVKNILSKLGAKNRTQAALRAREDGFK
ncbi:MAG: response regulator transcription factor [Shimia sp.]|uniref:response regulator transcription factor n=1 Tax=Shimia sp. TaxID=1954381 RepID=UPI0040594C92